MLFSRTTTCFAATLFLVSAAGCGHGGGAMLPSQGSGAPALRRIAPQKEYSILKMLKKQVVIGSTVDPKLHQLNPYGLSVAPSTAGDFQQGDLAVCNFNAKSNVQGTGYTIVALHPKPGSKPTLVSADKKVLLGCAALALGPADDIWAAAFADNDNPVLSASGKLEVNIKGKKFDQPVGTDLRAAHVGKPGVLRVERRQRVDRADQSRLEVYLRRDRERFRGESRQAGQHLRSVRVDLRREHRYALRRGRNEQHHRRVFEREHDSGRRNHRRKRTERASQGPRPPMRASSSRASR